jgi:hypothetical protein
VNDKHRDSKARVACREHCVAFDHRGENCSAAVLTVDPHGGMFAVLIG